MKIVGTLFVLVLCSCIVETGPEEEPPASAARARAGRGSAAGERDFVFTSPPASGAAQSAPCSERRVLFLNFDGGLLQPADADDAARNLSYLVKTHLNGQSYQVPAFDPQHFRALRGFKPLAWLGYRPWTRQEAAEAVRAHVAQLFAPYGVEVVTTRPAADAAGCVPSYTMIVIGGTNSWIEDGRSEKIGLAPLDCGNRHHANVGFIFSDTVFDYVKNPVQVIAEVAAHEAGHTFGLEHTWTVGKNGWSVQTIMTAPYDARRPAASWGAGLVTEADHYCTTIVGNLAYPWQDAAQMLGENLLGNPKAEGHGCFEGTECASGSCANGFCTAP